MRYRWDVLGTALVFFCLAALPALAQQKAEKVEEDKPPAGLLIQKIYLAKCVTCHAIGDSNGRG